MLKSPVAGSCMVSVAGQDASTGRCANAFAMTLKTYSQDSSNFQQALQPVQFSVSNFIAIVFQTALLEDGACIVLMCTHKCSDASKVDCVTDHKELDVFNDNARIERRNFLQSHLSTEICSFIATDFVVAARETTERTKRQTGHVFAVPTLGRS